MSIIINRALKIVALTGGLAVTGIAWSDGAPSPDEVTLNVLGNHTGPNGLLHDRESRRGPGSVARTSGLDYKPPVEKREDNDQQPPREPQAANEPAKDKKPCPVKPRPEKERGDKPGWGFGDRNHAHTGPRGHDKPHPRGKTQENFRERRAAKRRRR